MQNLISFSTNPALCQITGEKPRHRRRTGLLAATLLCAISGAMNIGLLKAQEAAGGNAPVASLKSLPRLETELLVVTDTQSLPSAIKRTAGPFFLQVVNRTFASDLAIVIEPTTASRSAEPSLPPAARLTARRRGRQFIWVKGEPGEYDIKTADTGKLLCHLVMGEQQ
jgi:hypothetical protein